MAVEGSSGNFRGGAKSLGQSASGVWRSGDAAGNPAECFWESCLVVLGVHETSSFQRREHQKIAKRLAFDLEPLSRFSLRSDCPWAWQPACEGTGIPRVPVEGRF